MNRHTYFVISCSVIVMLAISGCGLLAPAESEKNTEDIATPQPQNAPVVRRGEVITEEDNIQIRPANATPNDDTSSRTGCSSASARTITKAYLLSIPLKKESISLEVNADSPLVKYVQANRIMFQADGAAIRCATDIGKKVMSLGKEAYLSSTDMHKTIAAKWGGKAAVRAAKAADTLQSHGASMFTLGEEMLWLAKVLPDVSNGHYDSYNAADSTSRNLLKQAIQPAEISSPADRKTANENMADLLNNTANQYVENLEQQIILLAGTIEMPENEELADE